MEWNDLLHDTWQTALVFASLLGFTRILGKTQIGQLTFYEYISGITIGSIAGNIVAAEPDKYLRDFYDLILFVVLTYLLSYATIKSRRLRFFVEGQSTLLIENGILLKDNMRKARLDLDELTAQLRQQGILDIDEVQFAILETSGTLSIIKKIKEQPASKADIGLAPNEARYPVELIFDGALLYENLQRHQVSKSWLQGELALQGIEKIEDVLYGVLDSKGKLFINKKESSTKSRL